MTPRRALWLLVGLVPAACSDRGDGGPSVASAHPAATASSPEHAATSASASSPGAASATPEAGAAASAAPIDDRPLEVTTREELFALTGLRAGPSDRVPLDAFLDKTFGLGSPYKSNQGNPALAKHFVGRAQCLAGLAGLTLVTEEQRRVCGADDMVPIWAHGDPSKAEACIDVFEFPNRPCELPFVWIGPTQAKAVCEAEGKRLCRQEEWMLACGGDPEGGPATKYAYGDELDLEICNTNKSATIYGKDCDPDTVQSAWSTCATNTEPSGAFPRCRSRFGVFDLHGNVAEIMTRRDLEDGRTKSQLKGSAFFYTDVARDENGKAPKGHPKIEPERMRTTYPDVCRHDPRWHVEPIGRAWHVNYHLGFRCCKSISTAKESSAEHRDD
jgi:hypothetical protein